MTGYACRRCSDLLADGGSIPPASTIFSGFIAVIMNERGWPRAFGLDCAVKACQHSVSAFTG